jgi:hypothetical protein
VWPSLHDSDSSLRLTLFTSAKPVEDAKNVEISGPVPDLPWRLSRARLALADDYCTLVSAMAAGLPFLTTPAGAEGLFLGELARHLVAESTADTVSQAEKLLSDDVLWRDVADQLTDLATDHFSARAFNRAVDDALLTCGLAPTDR